jgi:NADH-quinone oxidoreductase subunit L
VLATLAAVMTGIYMTRLIFLTFYGNARFNDLPQPDAIPAVSGGSDDDAPADGAVAVMDPDADLPTEAELGYDPDYLPTVDYREPARAPRLHGHDPHESPAVMLIPIGVLAFLAAIGGLINLPIQGFEFLGEWLEPVFKGVDQPHPSSFDEGLALTGIAFLFAAIGIGIAYLIYRRGLRAPDHDPLKDKLGHGANLAGNAYYYDRGISAFVDTPGRATATFLDETVDTKVIDGSVNGVAHLVKRAGDGLRAVQDGHVRRYAIGIVLGTTALLMYLLAYVGR